MGHFKQLAGVIAITTVLAAACSSSPSGLGMRNKSVPANYSAMSTAAATTLENDYYAGQGFWHVCVPSTSCVGNPWNKDWGADSLTYALFEYWKMSKDPKVPPMLSALASTALLYTPSTGSWSDVPAWDSIAASRDYLATGSKTALSKAEAGFNWLLLHTSSFNKGACPNIAYQQANGGSTMLKTAESDTNFVKAAILLYQITHNNMYLQEATSRYAAIRSTYFDPSSQLYSVYVYDNGKTCTRLPARTFASINGNMIWSGYELAGLTKTSSYQAQSISTAQAIITHLNDSSGIYENLQAENDDVEPLVEAMYLLALHGQTFASTWLTTNASAAAGETNSLGAYGRFYGGPPPTAPVTWWQSAGGLMLAFAVGALNPSGVPAPAYWDTSTYVAKNLQLGSTGSVSFTFTGKAVAIIGTIGEKCCEKGHAQVWIDGVQTFDQTGIWQDKSSYGHPLPNSVLFAWRWTTANTHTITIKPGISNAKEGGSFFHMVGYKLVS